MKNPHKKIIIVDEEDKAGYILSKNLSGKGFKVDYFDNGEKARDKIESGTYNMLITGIKGKKYGGLKLLKHIKEKELSTDVVIYTAYGDVESYIKASRLGAIEYINKPVTADFFESLINKLSGIGQPLHITRIETSDRRRHDRFIVSEPAHILRREKNEVKKIEASIQNISLSGVLLSSCYEFSENQEIEINLILSGTSVSASSVIKRIISPDTSNHEQNSVNLAGLEFLNIDTSGYDHFRRYMDSI